MCNYFLKLHDMTRTLNFVFSSLLLAAATQSFAEVAQQPVIAARDTITDNAIVYPESFEIDLNNVMTDWYMDRFAVSDAESAERSYDVNYPDSVYIRRLQQLPTVIDMPYNQIVRSYIDMYMQRRRGLMETLLGRSIYYMPIFEQALEKEGLPLELKYLPIIESALRPDATSRAGAAGLWQFMVATGRLMGLEVNSLVDERRDPYKSSEAAARYLKQMYDIYHDWHLVIASYNCGPGNVNKAIRRSGGKTDYWEIYNFLPRETRGYVPAFIAANYAMTYYREHNIAPVLMEKPLITDSIMVCRDVYFDQISAVLGIPVEELCELNPQYRRSRIPGHSKPYSLTLPSQQVYAYIEMQDSILAYDAAKYAKRSVVEPAGLTATRYHRIRNGETLSTIARRYGVSVNSLKRWNGLKSSLIRAGQRLLVGRGAAGSTSISKTAATSSTSKSKGSYHIVKKGETLWTISQKYGITTAQLKTANNLRSSKINIGQRLKIPRG